MEPTGLIVGLGNPGKEYEATRHNFGFMAVDAVVEACHAMGTVSTVSSKNDAYVLERCNVNTGILRGQSWFFAKPQAYMNRSGEAVQRIAAYYRIAPHQILVLHDELDLPLGRMRLKQGGGNAGHNGLKSIQKQLGTADFYRLRLGIGRPQHGDSANYVLGRLSSIEITMISVIMPAIIEGVFLFMRGDSTKAQQYCNAYLLPESL